MKELKLWEVAKIVDEAGLEVDSVVEGYEFFRVKVKPFRSSQLAMLDCIVTDDYGLSLIFEKE